MARNTDFSTVELHRPLHEAQRCARPQARFWYCGRCGETWSSKTNTCPVCGCGSVHEVHINRGKASGDYLDALLADQEGFAFALA